MGRHEVEIHDELLRTARTILGTTTLKDTVRIALERVIDADERRAVARRMAVRQGLDAEDPKVLDRLAVDVDLPPRARF